MQGIEDVIGERTFCAQLRLPEEQMEMMVRHSAERMEKGLKASELFYASIGAYIIGKALMLDPAGDYAAITKESARRLAPAMLSPRSYIKIKGNEWGFFEKSIECAITLGYVREAKGGLALAREGFPVFRLMIEKEAMYS